MKKEKIEDFDMDGKKELDINNLWSDKKKCILSTDIESIKVCDNYFIIIMKERINEIKKIYITQEFEVYRLQ